MAIVPIALGAASLLGGIFGKKRKHIDPEYLRQHFGARAMAQETQDIVNFIQNSPYGQQLLASAAEQGQAFQNDMAAKAAAAGLDPSSGGQAGAGDFATSAAAQAQTGLERGVRAGFYQTAMPIAAENVAGRQAAYIADRTGGGYQSDNARMWQGIGEAAGAGLAATGPGQATPPPMSDSDRAAYTTAANAIVGQGPAPQLRPATGVQAAGTPIVAARPPLMPKANSIGEVLRGNRNVRRRNSRSMVANLEEGGY